MLDYKAAQWETLIPEPVLAVKKSKFWRYLVFNTTYWIFFLVLYDTMELGQHVSW